MTPERRAVLLLLALALLGHAARWLLARRDAPPGGITVLPGVASGEALLARRDSLRRLARPLGPGERVDLDRAPAGEIARLPGVGMALAKRIEAERARTGALGSLEALDRVPGVGPGLLARIGPHVTFSAARPALPAPLSPSAAVQSAALAGPAERGAPADTLGSALRRLLESGSVAELEALPGIGVVLARRIVAYRDSASGFRTVQDATRVRGLTRALLSKLDGVARKS